MILTVWMKIRRVLEKCGRVTKKEHLLGWTSCRDEVLYPAWRSDAFTLSFSFYFENSLLSCPLLSPFLVLPGPAPFSVTTRARSSPVIWWLQLLGVAGSDSRTGRLEFRSCCRHFCRAVFLRRSIAPRCRVLSATV